MKIFPVAFLALIVAVSACIGGEQTNQQTTTGNGITINDFSSSVPSVEGGGKGVSITLEAENKGGSKIANTLTCILGNNFPGNYKEGLWELSSSGNVCKAKYDLFPPDPFSQTPGEALTASWRLNSPCIPTTLSRTDIFTGRVYYDYNSSASTSAWVYSETELRAAQQKGDTVPGSLTVEKTVGPIQIDLSTVQPVRYDSSGTTFTLKITFANVGGGTVFDNKQWKINDYWKDSDSVPPIKDEELNVFNAHISVPSSLELDASCKDGGSEVTDIELRKGQSITKTCEITVNEDVTTKKSYPLTVIGTYGYYIDSSLSLVSNGKKNDANCV